MERTLKIRIEGTEETRRLTLKERPSFEELNKLLRQLLFLQVGEKPFVLKYKDDEGDFITISQQIELEEAWSFASGALLRLTVFIKELKEETNPEEEMKTNLNEFFTAMTDLNKRAQELHAKRRQQRFQNVVHPAICDGCDKRIVGNRFKCLNCEDYDLCQVCIAKKDEVHAQDHQFAQILFPRGGWRPLRFGFGRKAYGCCPSLHQQRCSQPVDAPSAQVPEERKPAESEFEEEEEEIPTGTTVDAGEQGAESENVEQVPGEIQEEIEATTQEDIEDDIEESQEDTDVHTEKPVEEQKSEKESVIDMIAGMGFDKSIVAQYYAVYGADPQAIINSLLR